MGHHVDYVGELTVTPPLHPAERDWLVDFQWDTADKANALGLPDPPRTFCDWEPVDDGSRLRWDGGERFFDGAEWIAYLIDHLLGPEATLEGDPRLTGFTFDHVLNGVVHRFAAPEPDIVEAARITVVDNGVVRTPFRVPSPLPLASDPEVSGIRLTDAFFYLQHDDRDQAREVLAAFLDAEPIGACGELADFLREIAGAFGPRDEVEAMIDEAAARPIMLPTTEDAGSRWTFIRRATS